VTPPLPPAPGLPEPPGPPDATRPRRTRWAPLLASLAVVGLLVWGARVVAATARAVAAAESAQDARVEAYAERFGAIPLLTADEEAALRRSLNARHVERAQALGVAPPATRAARDRAADSLVAIDTLRAFVVRRARYSAAAVTPSTAASLDSVAAAFGARTRAAGVPGARPTVTSVFRSDEDQAALRLFNTNAAPGTSSHEYATTYDLAYRRFEPVTPPAPPVPWSGRTPRWLRPLVEVMLAERWSEAVAGVAADYPSRYDALLGRALIALEDRGVVVVVREQSQPVYHVTLARRLVGR